MKCPQHGLIDMDGGTCSVCEEEQLAKQRKTMALLRDQILPLSVGPGELFDRYTILRLKARKVDGQDKRQQAHRESLTIGRYIYGQEDLFELPGLTPLIIALENCNERLWNIEDEIRALDSSIWVGGFKELDAFESHVVMDDASEHVLSDEIKKYCELARSVYVTNDERSQLKKKIDEACGHKAEVKQYSEY